MNTPYWNAVEKLFDKKSERHCSTLGKACDAPKLTLESGRRGRFLFGHMHTPLRANPTRLDAICRQFTISALERNNERVMVLVKIVSLTIEQSNGV